MLALLLAETVTACSDLRPEPGAAAEQGQPATHGARDPGGQPRRPDQHGYQQAEEHEWKERHQRRGADSDGIFGDAHDRTGAGCQGVDGDARSCLPAVRAEGKASAEQRSSNDGDWGVLLVKRPLLAEGENAFGEEQTDGTLS